MAMVVSVVEEQSWVSISDVGCEARGQPPSCWSVKRPRHENSLGDSSLFVCFSLSVLRRHESTNLVSDTFIHLNPCFVIDKLYDLG